MPVTINGDGSITGLAVGGLPDGSVDADTLASNAVTTTKLASGAVTNTKVNDSAAIAGSKLGAGSIIQVQTFKGGTADQDGTTNSDVVLDSFSFTTTRANSRLLLHYHSGQIRRNSQDMNAWIWTSVDSTSRHGNMYHYQDHDHYFYGHQTSLGPSDHRAFNVGFDISNQLSVGAHTIRIGCHCYNGNARFNYQGGYVGRRFTLIAMEVAQ